ncbi:MAG: PDZ domain-containing protein [Bacteroidota bacterium]
MKSTRSLFTLLAFCCFWGQIDAQTLARKGTLGIQMQANQKGKGIEILKVYENTTASAMSLQAGDILLSINNIGYNDVNALVAAVGEWRTGDEIRASIKRKGKELKMYAKVVGKPLETSEFGKVTYGAVDYDGGKLRTILTLPNEVENPPVLFFMQGIGCASIDYPYSPNSVVKLLIEEIVKNGVAVFRMEKPYMGDSYGKVDCREMDYPYEVGAFEAGLKTLKSMPEFDTDNIFLFGESLSAITAPVIAQKHAVAGIVAWGGLSTSWFEYSLRQMRTQKIMIGKDVVSIENRFRKYVPLFYDFFIIQKNQEELENTKAYQGFLGDFLKGDQWRGLHHYRFFQTLNEVDVLTAYAKADCSVLALAGEYDIHTIGTDWTKEVAYAVNQGKKNKAEIVIFPKTTHHYFKVNSLEAYSRRYLKGEISSSEMAENFNTKIGQTVADWIESNLK